MHSKTFQNVTNTNEWACGLHATDSEVYFVKYNTNTRICSSIIHFRFVRQLICTSARAPALSSNAPAELIISHFAQKSRNWRSVPGCNALPRRHTVFKRRWTSENVNASVRAESTRTHTHTNCRTCAHDRESGVGHVNAVSLQKACRVAGKLTWGACGRHGACSQPTVGYWKLTGLRSC